MSKITVYIDEGFDVESLDDLLQQVEVAARQEYAREIEWRSRPVQEYSGRPLDFDLNDPSLIDKWAEGLVSDLSGLDITRSALVVEKLRKG